QDGGVQHAVDRDVVDVAPLAAQEARILPADERLSDQRVQGKLGQRGPDQYWPRGSRPSAICPYMAPTLSQLSDTCRPTALASRHARWIGLDMASPLPPVAALSTSVARTARLTANAWPRRLVTRRSTDASPSRTSRAIASKSRSRMKRAASIDAAASATLI